MGFHLHARKCTAIDRTVNGIHAWSATLMATWVLASCDRPTEITVETTRAVTTRDTPPRLDATSDQRFRDAKPSPVLGQPPTEWLSVPSTQLRLLNYRFGDSGLGEVYVSLSSGTVPDNVNRWLKQFGVTALASDGLAALRQVPIADTRGVWVEAEGTYNPGMGGEPKSGYALAGIVADWEGKILTIKMIGPASEVKSATAALEAFASSLKRANDPAGDTRPAQ